MKDSLPAFLPGVLVLERGSRSDYFALERFHYLPKRPATWADVWRIRYSDAEHDRVIGVGVLSYPRASCRLRERAMNLTFADKRDSLQFVNRHIRSISRVVIHPQFRSLGLASVLVRRLIERCPTRFVEAVAMMGRAHPFFDRAGMRRFDPENPDRPIYYLYDRRGSRMKFDPEETECYGQERVATPLAGAALHTGDSSIAAASVRPGADRRKLPFVEPGNG